MTDTNRKTRHEAPRVRTPGTPRPMLALLTLAWVSTAPRVPAQEVQVLEHDTSFVSSHSLAQVDADTYALAYTGNGNDGWIKTFTISADERRISSTIGRQLPAASSGCHSRRM